MDNEQNLKNLTTPVQLKSTGIEATSPTTPYILNGEFYEILSQEGEGVTVRCRKCPGDNIYKGSVKSTGNFHMHIKRKHSELLPRVHEMKLKSFTERKFKMPQRRQQPYNNSGRKIIKNEKYQRKLSPEKAIFDQNNIQVEPIDYRKNPTTTLLDNMIITQIHNPIHNNYLSNSYPLVTNEQSNNTEYLFSTQSPPAAHQDSFEYVKKENDSVVRGVGDVNEEEYTTSFSDQQNYIQHNPNQIIMASTSSNNLPNIVSHHNSKQHQQPLQIISTSPTMMPLMTTAVTTAAIPGHDVLLRVENHLKGIEREMRLRNQIESNRIYLDLAKFKFLHPNFTLQN